MTGKSKPGESIVNASETEPNATETSDGRTGVLRWRNGPINAADVCLGPLPVLLSSLIADHGIRVLCGLTEGLDSFVVRVYYEDKSLALFPKTDADWSDLQKWAGSQSLLDDIRQYGETTEPRTRGKRR
jgi:hypothetical protein